MLHKKYNTLYYGVGIHDEYVRSKKKCKRHWGENINKRRKDAYKWMDVPGFE